MNQFGTAIPGDLTDVGDACRRLLESMAEGVSLRDDSGFILYTNPAEDRMFGYGPGELVGRHAAALSAYPPEENDRLVDEVVRCVHEAGAWKGEWRNLRRDGTGFLSRIHIAAIELDGQRLWLCLREDITERRRVERRQRMLIRLSDGLRSAPDIATAAVVGATRTGRHLEAGRAAYCEVDADGAVEVRGEWSDGLPSLAAQGLRGPLARLIAEAMVGGEPLALDDVEADPATAGAEPIGRSLLVVPLPMAEGGGAALLVADRRPRAWSEADRELVAEVAERVGRATGALRSARTLRASEERLRLAVESTGLGTWDVDPAKGRRRWSSEFKAILGLPPDTMPDYGVFARLIHPDDRDWVMASYRAVFAAENEGRYEAEFRIRRADDGAERWVVTTGRVLFGEAGRATRAVGTLKDVTDRRRSEDALREAEWRQSAILENISDGFYALDRDWRITYYNRASEVFFGVPREDALGRVIWSFLPRLAGTVFETSFRRVMQERVPAAFEAASVTREGRWVDVSAFPTPEGMGVSFRDHTERRQAQDRQRLLLNELNHRVKNTLATVQSIAVQTLRSAPSLDAFGIAFQQRLMALSHTHDLLTAGHWAGASLRDVVAAEFAPHRRDGDDRFVVRGDDVHLEPKLAVALGLAFHELATNAAKYGALTVPTGRVEVSWRIEARPEARRLQLDWIESGGPAVAMPARRGFGSRLIERGLAHELAGEAQLVFAPDGLRCTIDVPM